MSLRALLPVGLTLLLAAACCPVATPEAAAQSTAFTATVLGQRSDGLEVVLASGLRLVLVGDVDAVAGASLYVTGTVVGSGRIAVASATTY